MDNSDVDTVYHRAAAAARDGIPAVLVVVTRATGHTPQVVGAKMLVTKSGPLYGTVGGGRFEHEVILRARELTSQLDSELLTLALGAQLGMCCGGVMEVLLTPISSADHWLEEVSRQPEADVERWLRTSLASESLGQRRVSSDGAQLSGERRFENTGVLEGTNRVLVERLQAEARLVLFGAGHISQPTARIGALLGYQVSVIDDREDWNTAERFPTAAERILLPCEDYLDTFEPRPSDCLVIITRGHDFDQLILEHLVTAKVSYLGMIGSRSKVHKAFLKLRAAGVDEALIERICAPLGLDIGALTPEEIAVSIAAELVQHRRRTSNGDPS